MRKGYVEIYSVNQFSFKNNLSLKKKEAICDDKDKHNKMNHIFSKHDNLQNIQKDNN